ncbi:MAG: hypothetical protein H7Z76_10155, partial [Methylotenera sp.]|nr:hypothetical protein [Flavobacterium sp.]
MAKTVLMLQAFFGWKEIPLNAEGTEVAFSAEHEKLLSEKIGAIEVAKLKKALNSEIKAMTENNFDLKSIQDEIAAMVAELELTEEELETIAQDEKGDKETLAALKLIQGKQK